MAGRKKVAVSGKSAPDFSCEEKHYQSGCRRVAGIDEAGRGPLAGPVVAAAVYLPEPGILTGLDDSKKLTRRKREALYEALVASDLVEFSIGVVEPEEIDRINILKATHLAMQKAVEGLSPVPDMCLIDGLPVKGFPFPQESIVKGDASSLSIAAASIVAKVTRDRIMQKYAEQYPQYGFEKHSGYGTKIHLEALKKYGPAPIHRRSFSPVAQASLPFFEE